jgi:hypothetical protein
MNMKLADDIAKSADIDFVAPVTFFNAAATSLVSNVSITWSSGVSSKHLRHAGTLRDQYKPGPAAIIR